MKKFLRLFYIVLIFTGFTTCTSEDTDWIRINNTFLLSINEQIKVIDSRGNALYVSVASITDSRCPSDVVCVRQGEAEVKILIEDTRNSQYKTLLCIGDCSPSLLDVQAFTFYDKEYIIKLLEVDPYPNSNNMEVPPKAGLKVYEN